MSIVIIIKSIEKAGDYAIFCWNSIISMRKLPVKRRSLLIEQVDFIGVQSVPIILVSALFIGSVLAFQLFVALHIFGAESLIGSSMGVSLGRELAPVFCAIMVTGRAGAAICAELASMRISDQIDAMESMSVDPFDYLIAPRVAAGILSLPILNILFFVTAVTAGWFISSSLLGLDGAVYWSQFSWSTDVIDIMHGLVKSLFFGFILSSVGCYYGFNATGGATAVGRATNKAVVVTFLVVLFSDYIITSLLPQGLSILYVQ